MQRCEHPWRTGCELGGHGRQRQACGSAMLEAVASAYSAVGPGERATGHPAWSKRTPTGPQEKLVCLERRRACTPGRDQPDLSLALLARAWLSAGQAGTAVG